MKQVAIRSRIVAPKGYSLLAMDLSQAESWIVAFSSRDLTMQDALMNKDIHCVTASAFFNRVITKADVMERYVGKKGNHAFAYRESANMFVIDFNKEAAESGIVMSLGPAKKYRASWHELYPNVSNVWWLEIEEQLKSKRTLVTCYGRRREFYGWNEEVYKEGTAFLPQGGVADHFLGAIQPELGIRGGLLEIWKWSKRNHCKITNTAHDSFLMEVPKGREVEIAKELHPMLARPIVIHGKEFTIPVDAEYGDRWKEMESIKL